MFQKPTRSGVKSGKTQPPDAGQIFTSTVETDERVASTVARNTELKVFLHEKLLGMLNLSVLDTVSREDLGDRTGAAHQRTIDRQEKSRSTRLGI